MAVLCTPMMFQAGANTLYQSRFQPGGDVDRQSVPFRVFGGGHQHLHSLGRRERGGDHGGCFDQSKRNPLSRAREISWGALLLVAGLFVMVYAVESQGVLNSRSSGVGVAPGAGYRSDDGELCRWDREQHREHSAAGTDCRGKIQAAKGPPCKAHTRNHRRFAC
jgi:hypothetical protein